MRSWFCVDVNNVEYLAADTAVKCWSSETNHSQIATLSFVVFLLYTIAFPVVLFFMLRAEAKKRLTLINKIKEAESEVHAPQSVPCQPLSVPHPHSR